MRKTLLFVIGIGVVLGMVESSFAYNGRQVNGKAVSIQWRAGIQDWAPMTCESGDDLRDGSILLYTIQNSLVTDCDTIHRREQGLAQYPAFNLAGSKIAFYRLGKAPAATGNNCVTFNGGKSYISTINPDGTGVTDLCELLAAPQASFLPLDWPAGDWIYFEMPHTTVFGNQGNGSLMLYRVHAVTKAMEKVANLTNNGSGAELMCSYIHRFTLSAKGDRMALMTYPKYTCDTEPAATEFFSHVNTLYNFPPSNGNLGTSSITGRPGCNMSVSPSGKIVANYFAGNHDDMQLTTVGNDPSVGLQTAADGVAHVWIDENNNPDCPVCIASSRENLTKWNGGVFVGYGSECIRWSANSDKWVGQCIGFTGSGHAGSQAAGSNQVVCNFVDKVVINVSKNPTTAPGDVNGQGVIRWNNCTGDFWVDDPANNPNRDKYEDLQGVWHNIDGTPARRNEVRAGPAGAPAIAVRSGSARAVHVSVQGNAPWSIGIAGVDGRTLHTLTGTSAGDITVPVPSASGRIAVVTLTQNGMRVVKRCVLR